MIHQIKPLLVAPAFNGASCHPEMERWVPCNEQPCAIDGEWTLWSGWSPCSAACGDGTQERIRDIAVAAEYGGIECQGESKETMDCQAIPCPVDCEVTDWADADGATCSTSCGGGTIKQERTITVEADHSGEACPTELERQEPCNTLPCPANGGASCEAPLEEWRACNEENCPVDCVWD